jgi:hypothetical protein
VSCTQRHWTTAKDLLVGADGKLTEIADHGEISMDNPTQLANFIQRGVKVKSPLTHSPPYLRKRTSSHPVEF